MSDNHIMVVTSVIVPYEEKFVYVKSRKDGKYGLPGGKVEPFEDIRIAAPREVEEETGLVIVLENLIGLFYNRSERGNPILNTVYSSKVIEGIPRIIRPDEIEEIVCLSLGEIREFYREKKLRSGVANLMPVEEYLRGKSLPLSTIKYLIEDRE